jgi:cytosine deaminase
MLGMNWIERSLELITDNGAAALNISEYGIKEGLPARCVVLQGTTPYEVLLGQHQALASIRDGKILMKRDYKTPESHLLF